MQQAIEFFQGSAVLTMKYSIGDFDRDIYRCEESLNTTKYAIFNEYSTINM